MSSPRAETSYTPMLSELGSRLNELAPDLALKMELIQTMRREARNSTACDEVEEILWLSIDKVLTGIEEIRNTLTDLVLADMEENSIIISGRDTIKRLNAKVSQQKDALSRMQAKLREEQALSNRLRDRLARMKRRDRQKINARGTNMSDVVEAVINRQKDQEEMY